MAEALPFDYNAVKKIIFSVFYPNENSFAREILDFVAVHYDKVHLIVDDLMAYKETTPKLQRMELGAFMEKYYYNPWKYFESYKDGFNYLAYSRNYLKQRFPSLDWTHLPTALRNNNYSLYKTYKQFLDSRTPLSTILPNQLASSNQFFKDEVFLIEHERELIQLKRVTQKIQDTMKKTVAEEYVTCACCFDDQLPLRASVFCDKGHIFCKACVKKSSEVEIVAGRTQLKCIADCNSEFNILDLRGIISEKLLEKYESLKQVTEVKEASIEGLVFCPFCNFAAVPHKNSKVFYCIGCNIPSCLNCKKSSHESFTCEEVAILNIRTQIEDKLTSVLVRTCKGCGRNFIRDDGCNKMVCLCGAKMCYVCRKPVESYDHFTSDPKNSTKCPLYTENSKLHYDAIVEEASLALMDHPDAAPQLQGILKGLEKETV